MVTDSLLPAWLLEAHKERYRKVALGEMSLSRALEENDEDWRRLYEEASQALGEAA